MKNKTYFISEKDLVELISSDLKLTALQRAGVEDWVWYGDNFDNYKKELCTDFGSGFEYDEYDEDITFHDIAVELVHRRYRECKSDGE